MEKRRQRYDLLRKARLTIPFTRTSACLYAFRKGEVAVVQRGDGRCGYAGFMRCGSRWRCPNCSARAAAADYMRSLSCFQKALDAGHCLFQVTYTMRHQVGIALAESLAVMRKAQQLVHSGRAWQDTKARYSLGERSYGAEMTYGANGWHVHRHAVYEGLQPPALRNPAQRRAYAAQLAAGLEARWLAALEKVGGPEFVGLAGIAVKAHVVAGDGDDAEATARYLTKYAMETTQRVAKFGRRGSRTPWQILEAGHDPALTGKARAFWRAKFREYSDATHGLHGVWLSKGWAVQAPEPTQAELTADDPGMPVLPVPDDYVRILRHQGALVELLERVEREGPALAKAWMTGLRYDGIVDRYSRGFTREDSAGPAPGGWLCDREWSDGPWPAPLRKARSRAGPAIRNVTLEGDDDDF